MKHPKLFTKYTSVSLLFLGMSSAGVSLSVDASDITPHQTDAKALSLRTRVANSTDRIIVKYREPTTSEATINTMVQRTAQFSGYDISRVGRTHNGAHILKLRGMRPLAELRTIISEIEGSAEIEYAEPDLRMLPLFTPNDPRYNEQWHYYEAIGGIGLPPAWDLTQGENSVVAVIDTGYLPHRDLVDNILPGYDMISGAYMANDGDGRDDDPTDPGDYAPFCDMPRSSWHGTHVAGTIAALGNNDIGVTGVAFAAKILPVRALGRCGGYMSDIADGIVWASGADVSGAPNNPYPANVINMSLGGDASTCPRTYQEAIDTARSRGTSVVVAAGNESRNSSQTTPGNCNGVISVAATTRTAELTPFSNYGNLVDIAAPGDGILSTYNSGIIRPGSDNYAYAGGTSMASPQVAGVAALLYAARPDITPDQVEQILKGTAREFPQRCNGCGAGIVDAGAAVNQALDITTREFENDTDFPIPNYRFIGATSPIAVPLGGESGNVEITVAIKHPDISEVIVALIAPDNQFHILKRYGGELVSDLNETYTLDLGQLPAAGNWRLRALDFGANGEGYIDNWGLSFQ